MHYRDFGKTGLKVSAIVFGAGAVGGLVINQNDRVRRRAIERALAAGINWIDTAPLYGQGKSEEALGWLLEGAPAALQVSTKVHIDAADSSDIRGQVQRSIEASLKRLRRASVTLLQLHNPLGAASSARALGVEEVLKRGGVLDALEEVKRQGLASHIGITALGETPSVIRAIETGRIASAQVYYNLLNPTAAGPVPANWPAYSFDGILDACARNGVAAMNIRVFSAGVIATDKRTGRETPLTAGDTVNSEAAKARAVFAKLKTSHGSRAQTAIRFALAEPRISCVVFGLAELSHLEEAIKAEAKGPLPQTALDQIRSVYADAKLA